MRWRLFTFSMLLSIVAHANPSNLQLSWSAPGNCPDAGQIRAQIDGLLGKPADSVLSSPLYVSATVRQEGEERWVLEISWHPSAAQSVRTIQADSCVDLARAAALSTALVIEPNAITRGGNDDSTTEAAPALATPKVVAPKTNSPRGFVSQPRETLRIVPRAPSAAPVPIPRRADFFGVAAVASGVLPGAALGVAIGAEFALKHVVVRSEIGTYLPQSWSEEKEGYKGSFWLSEVFQSACYPIGATRFRISPCVDASLQGYLVQVQDLGINDSSSRLAWAVRVGVGVDAC